MILSSPDYTVLPSRPGSTGHQADSAGTTFYQPGHIVCDHRKSPAIIRFAMNDCWYNYPNNSQGLDGSIIMDTLEAIFTRYSCDTVRPDPVPRELLEKLLAAAVQAPNHFKVRPWRFVVLQGQARERLGDLFVELLLEQHPDAPQSTVDKERAKPLRAPVVIAVGIEPTSDPRAIETENICAAASAVENLLLAAHALGLGAKWRTGSPAKEPRVKNFLGLHPDRDLIAFIYIGFPAAGPASINRPSFEDRTTWLE